MVTSIDKQWSVYVHTSPKGKRYVGITCRPPVYRWNHGRGYSQNTHFSAAIAKYGWDNFTHEVVASGLSKEVACAMEKQLISEYNTTDGDFGYNMSTGGESGSLGVRLSEERKRRLSESRMGEKHHLYGTHPSEETRRKMSKSHKGRITTEETRVKLSRSLTGKNLSVERKQKISETLRSKWQNEEYRAMMVEAHSGKNSHKARRVRCVETGEVFGCIKEACAKHRVHSSTVSNVCRGKLKTTGGYHWEYVK